MSRKRIYASKTERQRIWRSVNRIHASVLNEHAVEQGEAEARLIVRRLDARGVAAEVVERAGKWIVRKTKGESE